MEKIVYKCGGFKENNGFKLIKSKTMTTLKYLFRKQSSLFYLQALVSVY